MHKQLHPDEGPVANQNIKDRFLGRNDPVAGNFKKENLLILTLKPTGKIIKNMLDKQTHDTSPPDDQTIKSLCIRNIQSAITLRDIENVYDKYGEIDSYKMLKPK